MATHLNIPPKIEGSKLTAPEFNAVVTAINENGSSLESAYDEIQNKLGVTTIVIDSETSFVIDSIESLIEYLHKYGTATPYYNTAPLIKINKTTYVYKAGQRLDLELELFDSEGGFLSLTGSNPTVPGGYNTFSITGLRSGFNTINFNEFVFNNTTSRLDVGTYIFSDIYVTDALGRSSLTPLNLKIIIGSIELQSGFDSTVAYEKNKSISVRYGVSSITNSLKMTYRISGKMLIDDGTGNLSYQPYTEVVDVNEEFKVTSNDADFVTGDVYYHNYVIPEPFSQIGDYNLTIVAEGLGDGEGVFSNTLTINIVVNEPGVLYSSSLFDSNGTYYAGDSIDIPVNIYYNETPDTDYTYQAIAWIEGLNITGSSNVVSEQKNIPLRLTLPDDPDLYTILYRSQIITPSGEVYKTNTNYIALQAKPKSIYNVVTDSSSKLELYLTAKGKTNASPNWQVWENRYNLDQSYYGDLIEFAKLVNGWELRKNNNQHTGDALYASGTSYCLINYKPFDGFDLKGTGLTLDFSIRHGDLISPNNYNLSIGRPSDYPQTGVYVFNNTLQIRGLNSPISVPIICDKKVLTKLGEWEDGDEYAHITITYNFQEKEVFVYLNGVISSYGTFSNASTIAHSYPIVFNGAIDATNRVSGIADSKMRFIRVYKTCLTHEQVLGNYIASYPDDSERLLLEGLNDQVNPILSTSYLKGDRVGIIKDEMRRLFFSFVPGNEQVIADTYIPNPIAIGTYGQQYMDMKEEMPVDVDLQGNSSLSYPVKNYGMDIYDAEAWNNFRIAESKEYNMVYNKDKLPEYRPWANWDSYHLKANYIDSSHCNNLIMAKLSEQIFRLPYNWQDVTDYFPTTTPFKNFTVVRPDGVIDPYSRFPVYPVRLAVDGFPFVLKGDYVNTNGKAFEKEFIGVYTWNMKQHRKLYALPSASTEPNKRSFIYRCESNGDSVHEQLRSGYCKFIDMKSQELLLDSYERVVTRQYIASQEDKQMFLKYQKTDYTYYPIGETTGYLQTYNNKYTWIKYGIGINGQDMSDSNISKTHIGIAIDKDSPIKSNNPLDYTWHSIDVYEGIPNESGTFTLVQYAANENGDDLSGSSTNKFYIAFKYNAVKDYWVEGVDYFNKTGDPQEMQWRPGAELIMDWECREPDDLGNGHWEEFKNGQWITTYDIIDPKDLDRSATEPDKVLRFVWDNINSNGDAKRSGNATVDYYPSILDSNVRIPTLSDPNQTFAAINKNKAISATRYHVDFINAITWMSNASDECFGDSKIFEKYFDLRNCIDYVLSCLTFCLTDSIGRNLTMIAWDQNSVKIAPGIMQREKMRFYPVFYDIDTAFGTNVQGGLYSTPYIAWPYDIGDLYKAAEGAGQEYNCFGTLFLKRISKCYAKQMARRYQELRSGTVDPLDSKTKLPAPFDYLNILQLYTKQMIGRIGERYFNEDAVYKYIGFDNDPDETAKRNYITNARGNKIMFMKNFLKKRLDYIDSLMGYVPDTDDMAYFQHYSSGQLTLTIRTMVAGYVRVSFAQNQIVSVYCDGINPVSVSYNYSTVTQHILRIYNCGIITHLAGLANKDVRIARLNSMINLMILDLRGNPNFGTEVSTLEISECKNLRTIDLTGCNGANEFTPDISGCIFLEEFLISNSSVGNVSFANNLNIKTIDVRNSPRFNTLDISNLYRLTSLNYDEHRLVSLNISNSAYSIDFSQPNIYNNLLALSIVNNRAITNLSFGEGSFQKLQQLTISECSKLVSVVGLFKNRTGYPSLNTDFLARCPLLQNVDNLFENSVIEVIPSQMFLDSNGIKTMIGLFKDCKNIKTIPVNVFDSLPNLEDITDIFNGASLQYYTDITDFDEYGSEYVIGKQSHSVFRSDNIFSNCPKLKFATRAFANSELINVPKNIFANSPILQNIEYCFSGILNLNSYYEGVGSPLVFPNTLWITAPLFMSIKGVFKDTFINQIHDNIFSSCPKLTNASQLFYGSTLTNIPTQIFSVQAPLLSDLSYAFASTGFSSIYENFLNNFPNLSNIQNIFYGSKIISLPNGFLVNNKITSFKFSDLGIPLLLNINSDILSQNTVLTSIQNLFSNTQILNSPNNLFSNNPNVSNIAGFLANSNIDTIGENFLLTNRVEDISNLFKDKTGKIIQLGAGFMQNSLMLKQANSVFENCTSIISTPSNMLSNCPELLSASKFFYNASNLSNINSGFLKNAPKLQIISDIFKGTTISQIKDDILLNPNISIFKFSDILNHKVTISVNFLKDSTISNIDNLFTDTLIEQIPSDFFSTHSVVNPLQMFYNSSIKTIGDNCFSSVSIEDASDMFQNCPIVSIGANFMQNSGVKYMNNMFNLSTTINSIGANFMGDKALVESASGVFQNSTIQSIGSGFLSNSPLLTNVQNIFDGCALLVALPTDFIKNSPLISSLSGVFSNNGIKTISNNFCEGNTGITTLNGIFSNSNIEAIGDYFFKNSTGIVSIANMFLNNQKIKNIGNFFFDGSALTNVSSAFKGSSIQTIGQNIFNGCQVQNASSLLEGATKLASIGQNFFNNMPSLVNIQNIFKTTSLSSLPVDFIKGSFNIDSLVGVFAYNNITSIPDNFCENNTGITTLAGTFTGANVVSIGDNFMKGSTGLTSINNGFVGNSSIQSIGKLFMENSAIKTADYAFQNVTSINKVGSGMFQGCQLTSVISMFEGCSNLNQIGEYIEWYDPIEHNNYLYVKDSDETKCNTAGQQAEVNLFVSVPYLQEEYDSFTGLTDLTRMANIFKGTGLIRTPKGFLKNSIYTSGSTVLSTILAGSNIKFFNPDLFSGSQINNISNLFDNTGIIAIPTGFMSDYTTGTQVEIQWINKKDIQKVAYIPKTFLRNCILGLPSNIGDANIYFNSTNIRMLQNDWLDWINPTQYWVEVNDVQYGPSFNYSELVNIPRGYLKNGVKSLKFNRDTFLYADKMDTIIPEFAFNMFNSPYSNPNIFCEAYFSCFYSGSIKGVVPKTFLDFGFSVSSNGLKNLFMSQNIIGLENGCLTKQITGAQTYLQFNGVFNDCTKLRYIPSTLFSGYNTQKTINFALTFRNCILLKTFPDMLKTVQNITGTNGMFYGCIGMTNSDGSLDSIISNLTNQSSLVDASEMFRDCSSLQTIPDNTFANSNIIELMQRVFYGCNSLQNLPSAILTNNTKLCNCDSLFTNCSSLQSIPNDFMRYSKVGNFAHAFNGCSNLVGMIPSNLLLLSSGFITHLYNTFYNCSKITGFENNVWNVTDFSQVVEMQFMFYNSGITTIPPSFCNNNTFLKAIRCDNIFGKSKITTVPNNFINNCPLLTRVDGSFNNISTLLSIGTGIYENCPKVTNTNGIFKNDSNLTGVIPVSFLRNSILITDSNSIFNNTKVTGIESGNIFERLTSASNLLDFKSMFFNCTNFTGSLPQFWILYPNVTSTNKQNTFSNCYNSSNWYKVPISWGGTLQRSFIIIDSSTSMPIQGANVQIGSNNYTTDSRGVVSISGESAIASATISALGYKTITTSSYSSITDVAYHTISLLSIQTITFQVKTTDGLAIPGASVLCDGQTVYTNALGQAQIFVVAGTYSYTVSYSSKSSTGSITALTNITQNIVLSLPAYEIAPSENNNIQILTKGAGMMLNIYSSDSSYTIDWGDGLITNSRGNGEQTYSHVYPNSNYYLINIMNCQNITSCMTGIPEQLICYWSVGNSQISNLSFMGNSSLRSVGQNIFKNDSTRTSLSNVFNGCTLLSKVPNGIFNPCTEAILFVSSFEGCASLQTIPSGLFQNINAYNTSSMFKGSGITSIPIGLYPPLSQVLYVRSMFMNCLGITSIPSDIFNYQRSAYFNSAFQGCSNINTAVPDLWSANQAYEQELCFAGCTKASNYASIPAAWK